MTKIPDTFAIVALIILAASPAYAGDARSHGDEIKLFATTMAIAKTVKESCPSIKLDDRFLEELRLRRCGRVKRFRSRLTRVETRPAIARRPDDCMAWGLAN